MTKVGYELVSIRSHVEDADDVGEVFSRDCPEYTIATPTGPTSSFSSTTSSRKASARPPTRTRNASGKPDG
jgi:hypothetical protein